MMTTLNMATSKFTTDVQKKIVNMLRKGNYADAACKCASISYSTYRNWLLKGEAEPDSEYGAFKGAVEAASGLAEADAVESLVNAGTDDYKAAVVYLERRFPERWASSTKVSLLVDRQMTELMDLLAAKLPEAVFRQVVEAVNATDSD